MVICITLCVDYSARRENLDVGRCLCIRFTRIPWERTRGFIRGCTRAPGHPSMFFVSVFPPRSYAYFNAKRSKRAVPVLFQFTCRPVVVGIISTAELVNLHSLHHDFFYVRPEISLFQVLLVRDPFLFRQIDLQEVQLDGARDPGNSVIPDTRGFTHSFAAHSPDKYAESKVRRRKCRVAEIR